MNFSHVYIGSFISQIKTREGQHDYKENCYRVTQFLCS